MVRASSGNDRLGFSSASINLFEALEKARSDMEYNREGSLLEFQKKLDEKLVTGVEQARTHLMSQVGPLMEAWEEAQKHHGAGISITPYGDASTGLPDEELIP